MISSVNKVLLCTWGELPSLADVLASPESDNSRTTSLVVIGSTQHVQSDESTNITTRSRSIWFRRP